MMQGVLLLALALSRAVSLAGAEELLQNADFEDAFSSDNWFATGQATLERSSDAYAGNYSGKISNRAATWNGLGQWVNMDPNSKYRFRAYVKLLNLIEGYLYHNIKIDFQLEFTDGSTSNEQITMNPYHRPDWGWEEIGGDYTTDATPINRGKVDIRFSENETLEFLVDAATLTKLTDDRNWKNKANRRIDELRKDNVTVNIQITNGDCDPAKVEVKLDHFYHDYPFGSGIRALPFTPGNDESDDKYQQVFFDNFNWGTIANALKWKAMEKTQGEVYYERVDNALDHFDSHNIKVRGHTITWGGKSHNPEWLWTGYEGDAMKEQISRRINYTVSHFRGRFKHLDVNNEQCHGDWYEQKTGDHDLIKWMFREVHRLDPDAKLFLNDFAVVRSTHRTVCFSNAAKRLKNDGVPVHILGIQSHIKPNPPDITLYQDRLDTLASSGLPLWITAMTYEDANVTRRADAFEDALRLYFSQKAIIGITIWHFGNETTGNQLGENATLFDGPNYEPNEAGTRVKDLIHKEWSTREKLNPQSADESFSFRGFRGNYTVVTKYDGAVKNRDYFYVAENQTNHLDVVITDC